VQSAPSQVWVQLPLGQVQLHVSFALHVHDEPQSVAPTAPAAPAALVPPVPVPPVALPPVPVPPVPVPPVALPPVPVPPPLPPVALPPVPIPAVPPLPPVADPPAPPVPVSLESSEPHAKRLPDARAKTHAKLAKILSFITNLQKTGVRDNRDADQPSAVSSRPRNGSTNSCWTMPSATAVAALTCQLSGD